MLSHASRHSSALIMKFVNSESEIKMENTCIRTDEGYM